MGSEMGSEMGSGTVSVSRKERDEREAVSDVQVRVRGDVKAE